MTALRSMTRRIFLRVAGLGLTPFALPIPSASFDDWMTLLTPLTSPWLRLDARLVHQMAASFVPVPISLDYGQRAVGFIKAVRVVGSDLLALVELPSSNMALLAQYPVIVPIVRSWLTHAGYKGARIVGAALTDTLPTPGRRQPNIDYRWRDMPGWNGQESVW